jgi:hypothetical protein
MVDKKYNSSNAPKILSIWINLFLTADLSG